MKVPPLLHDPHVDHQDQDDGDQFRIVLYLSYSYFFHENMTERYTTRGDEYDVDFEYDSLF